MSILVIGDSITYIVDRKGGVDQFAAHGITAHLDGDPGDRASTPARDAAWRQKLSSESPDTAFYALGTNDLMKETFRDPEREDDASAIRFSPEELAATVAAICGALHYAQSLGVRPGWVNVTERTMSGWYNMGARELNAAMLAICNDNDWIYVDWNAQRAPTTDLIHPKASGAKVWVDIVAEAVLADGE